jgi:hypothetical protein
MREFPLNKNKIENYILLHILKDKYIRIKRGTMRTPGLVEARIQDILYFLRHRTAIVKLETEYNKNLHVLNGN